MSLIEKIESFLVKTTITEGLIYHDGVSNRNLLLALAIARKIGYSDNGCCDYNEYPEKPLDKLQSNTINLNKYPRPTKQPSNYQKIETTAWGIDGTYFPPEELI
jgi:hypothetical protein